MGINSNFHEDLSKIRSLPFEESAEIGGREAQAYVEGAELTVHGARLIEAHLIDKLFEYQRVMGEEIHAPLPIIEADRAGNDLGHLPGVSPSDQTVLLHHPLACRDRG